MDFEENNGRYILKKKIADESGHIREFFEIGSVIVLPDGTKHYKPSAQAAFDTREKALEWLNGAK